MISFGNEASSHSGLIPLKTAYKKRGELLPAIASKKNFSNLHSAAFVTVCPEYANNWVKKLVIYYDITASLCKSFCDVTTRVR